MAGQLTIDTLKAGSGVLATQNGMTGIAKAWVVFVGSSGTINGSFNVSSITRLNTGYYQVNFTTTLPNANYAAFASAQGGASPPNPVGVTMFADSFAGISNTPTTSNFTFSITNYNGGIRYDPTLVMATVSGA